MWKMKYKKKMTVVTSLLVLCFMVLTGATLSKVGIMAMNKDDYQNSRDVNEVIKEDKAYYQKIMGDIYDTNGYPILTTDTVIDEASVTYHTAYSHLLGNTKVQNYGLLSSYYQTLTDDSAKDMIEHKGYSLSLTIDDELQRYAYSLTEGKRASVVVLKRHSGELLALTSTYEEKFNLGDELTDALLTQYSSAREPIWEAEYLHAYAGGSCQKIVTAAMAYEAGLDDFTIDDIGYVEYDGKRLYNNDKAVYGEALDITTAFSVSSNTYFASLMNAIDASTIRDVCGKLRLNDRFDTDFGTVQNTFTFGWRMGNSSKHARALLGIGQASELSSVGLAMAAQAVIDNEIYLPHIVKNTCYIDKDDTLRISEEKQERLLDSGMISDDTSAKVRKLMETAAHSSGYQLGDHILGAKSGTADITIDDASTNRATLVAYDENYIVVVSKIEAGAYGISNKAVIENIFDYLDEYQGLQG